MSPSNADEASGTSLRGESTPPPPPSPDPVAIGRDIARSLRRSAKQINERTLPGFSGELYVILLEHDRDAAKRYLDLEIQARQAQMDQARDDAEHRRAVARASAEAIRAEAMGRLELERRGQWYGLVVALAGFGVCGFAIYLREATAAIWLGSSMIVALVTVFLTGRSLRSGAASPPACGSSPAADSG